MGESRVTYGRNTTIKALHLSLSFKSAPALGGPDVTAYKLCTALRRQGVEVDVICTNLVSKTTVIQPATFERDIEGVHVTYLATRKLIPLGQRSFGLYYMPDLGSLLQRTVGKYDVIHLQGFRDFVSFMGYRHACSAGVPYVVHPRGTLPYQGHSLFAKASFDRLIGRRMIHRSAALIALAPREVESFIALGADRSKVHVVYNGIDPADYDATVSGAAFRERNGIHERFVILYFGRVHHIKGIDHMIRAAASLGRVGYDIAAVVVGSDEGYGPTLKRIAKQESFDHLYMVPPVSGKFKQEVFGAADVLVYAAQVEDFGVSAFEGVLSGVPTVVAAGTGCGQIVQGLDCGSLVPYGDVEALSDMLQGILNDPNAARARTVAARARVIGVLDWDGIGSHVRRIYEGICK